MQIVCYIRLILLLLIPCGYTFAQCPQPSFTIPDTVCINEPLIISNTSTGADRYEWDFCSGDLDKEPLLETVTTISDALTPTNITTVFDGLNWFGFISSRDNNSIFRLDFGNSLNNNPTSIELGNLGGLLARPEQMKIVKEGAQWIGLIVNLNDYVHSFSVVRLNFGNALTNMPTATRLTVLDNYVKMPRSIEIVNDQGNNFVFIANALSNTLTVINFKNSLNNYPGASDINTIIMPDPAAGINIMGISIIKECSRWYGLASSFNNKVYKLDFGTNLFSIPIITKITTTAYLNLTPVKVRIINEKARFFAILMHYNGSAIILDFGKSMDNVNPVILNTFGILGNIVDTELISVNSELTVLTIDEVNEKVIKYSFENPCGTNVSTSSNSIPLDIKYNVFGNKSLTLSAYDNQGNINRTSKLVFVRPQVIADFKTDNKCIGSTTTFSATDSPIGNRIVSYTWDFGNGNTASGKNAVFNFSSDGDFPVKLTIIDACGKESEIIKQVAITQRNIANFTAPVSSCSNENIRFEDASVTAGDVITKWQWNFGDGQTSTQQNPEHLYTEAGNFNVSLSITGESGCIETVSKAITITAGAAVDFMVENACLGNSTSFIDLTTFSTGTSEVSREWSFGDNTTSTDLHPLHTYAATGNYTVTLTIRNNLNCITTETKMITIRKKPEADFSYALACSGEAVSFIDESISTDGSIKIWQWDFGDTESGTNNYATEQQGSHVFTKAGIYKVKLKIETVSGCIDSLTKDVTIISSPQAVFTTQINCESKEVEFTDRSMIDAAYAITNWYWDFGDNTTSREQHPIHTYNSAGNYTVTLITTASSRCTNMYTKVIHIYDPPVADFTFPEIICSTNQVQFADHSTSIDDAITSWQWDFGSYGIFNVQHPQMVFTAAQLVALPVTLSIKTASGCNASVTKNIFIQQPAEAEFSHETVSALTPLSIIFSSTTNLTASLSWNFGDGNSSNQPNPQHTYESGGIYNVSLTAITAAGCSTVIQQEISVSSISADVELKLETVSVIKTGTTTELQIRLVNNSPYILKELEIATLLDEKNTYTHNWQGELLPGKMLSYTYTIPSNVSSNLTFACVTAISRTFDKTSNRQCSSIENIFSVLNPYPNPAVSEVFIPFLLPVKGEIEISLIDILGRLQTRYIYNLEAGFHQVRINKGRLIAGKYFIRYDFAGKKQVKSIIFN